MLEQCDTPFAHLRSWAEQHMSILARKIAQLLYGWKMEATSRGNVEGMQSCFVGCQQKAFDVKHHGVDWVPLMHGTDSGVCRTSNFWIHHMKNGGLHTTRRHLQLDCLSIQLDVIKVVSKVHCCCRSTNAGADDCAA